MRSTGQRKVERRAQFERVEERLAMTAQPVAAIALDHLVVETLETVDPLADLHTEASAQTNAIFGVTFARSTYGFTGEGQTVAVIDSGIAWDHKALGGGLGANYRVVGGWDFAENDADPYDDGPAGFHGTHVAGIIGSSNATYSGVAPGVDLVALRVFDDMGNGYFDMVEKALQWVHENRNSFENPITTVNLSLGTNWNADNTPSWATLEDEFAQLEADGIFISVAAGNSFASYNKTGLSYPAASPYVVPVSSVSNGGQMSDFSQRNDRVLAAPGESIVSTAPDYVGNFNGKTDDFVAASGTSMAAPYMAGASVLVRQAMEFAGYQNITQDMIYDHIRATSDLIYDSATSASYHVLNLENSLTALMPGDDFGSTVGTAASLGTISDTLTVSGTVGRLDDVDYFTFTAGHTGTMQLHASGDLADPTWLTGSLSGAQVSGQTLSLEVVAGQTYTVGLASQTAITHYELELSFSQIADTGTATLLEQARQLDQTLGLKFTGNDYFNWGGARERWMQGENGSWYFIKQDGSLYAWAGTGGLENSELVARLSPDFYKHLDLLYDAPDASITDAALAEKLDQALGLKLNRSYSMNWGGMGEKWIQAADGSWLFITPDGNLYSWAGGKDCSNSQLLASFDSSYYQNAALLHDAAAPADTVGELAYQLDQQLGLTSTGHYSTNWGGKGERWLQSQSGAWYFITPDGTLHQWDGKADLSTSTVVGKLDKTFYADPTKLTNASEAGVYQAQLAYQLDQSLGLKYGGSSYENWGGMNEKWMKDASGAWYFITPDGSLYKWNGKSDLATSQKVAVLDKSYYANTKTLYEAQTPEAYLATRADAFRQSLKLKEIVAPTTLIGGVQARWMQSRSGQTYLITSAGNLYRWCGSSDLACSEFVAAFNGNYYNDLSRLAVTGAPTTATGSSVAAQAIVGVVNTASADTAWMLAQSQQASRDTLGGTLLASDLQLGHTRFDTATLALAQENAHLSAAALAVDFDYRSTWHAQNAEEAQGLSEDDADLIAQALNDDDLLHDRWDQDRATRERDDELAALDALYGSAEDE